MMNLAILQLPYNIDNLQQILTQLSALDATVYFFDNAEKIHLIPPAFLEKNFRAVATNPYAVEEIVQRCEAHSIDSIVSFAELGLVVAAEVRDRLRMSGHSKEVEILSTNKHNMRTKLLDANLSKVRTKLATVHQLFAELKEFGLPAIVKPAALTGSIGVELIKKLDQLEKYSERINNNIYSKNCMLVLEDYLEGEEYSVEGLILDSELFFYGVTDKETSGAPYFVESGHRFHARHPLKNMLAAQLPAIFAALNMTLCPFHVEFKVVNDKVEIIELHSRFGGDFITVLIENTTGNLVFLDYLNYLLHGIKPALKQAGEKSSAIDFFLAPAGILTKLSIDSGLHTLPELVSIKFDFSEGSSLKSATGFYERVGRVIFEAPDNSQLAATSAKIREMVQIEVQAVV